MGGPKLNARCFLTPGSCSSAGLFYYWGDFLLLVFLIINGFFYNWVFFIIGGFFLDNLIFSKNFFCQFLVLEAKQSSQMASGAPLVAAKCPFLVPSRAVYPASVKKAISGQILSLHGYRCWPTRLCYPNGPGLGGVWITRAPMYLQGLHTQPVNTKGKTNPFISWL